MDEADYVAGNPRWNGSPRLVAVSGCSGGGKSALLAEMAARGYRVFPEPGRQVVKEGWARRLREKFSHLKKAAE